MADDKHWQCLGGAAAAELLVVHGRTSKAIAGAKPGQAGHRSAMTDK